MPRLTKKQQEALEEAAREERIRQALRWTGPAPARDVPPPRDGGLSTGYTYNAYTRRVIEACSSAVYHAIGRTDRTTTQRPIALYSTRLLALQALRATLEREFAEALEQIDQQIAREEAQHGEK